MDEAEITVNQQIKKLMGQTLDERFKETWSTMTPEDYTQFVRTELEKATVAVKASGAKPGESRRNP